MSRRRSSAADSQPADFDRKGARRALLERMSGIGCVVAVAIGACFGSEWFFRRSEVCPHRCALAGGQF